jgi:V/A-type H+-transporting ATPase subunit C
MPGMENVSGFDYGNARLRAMKSRLLDQRELDIFTGTDSSQGLIAALAKTAYGKSVEAAMARASGMDCIFEALRSNLVQSMVKIRKFYTGRSQELVNIVLNSYDVHNIKTIIRGLKKLASPGEIRSALMPIGELTDAMLTELTRAPGPRPAIDLLASMRLPIARPLLKLRAARPGADLPEIELALDRWYYQEAFQQMDELGRNESVLSSALRLDVDLANLITVIRFVHSPPERKIFLEAFGTDDFSALLLRPGHLSNSLLERAGRQQTLAAMVETFPGKVYEPALISGLKDYRQSSRLSDFEKHLRVFRLRWMSKLITKDPLGIGMLLGYLALKLDEVSKIRWIARGIDLGLNVDVIRAELENS